MSREILTEVVAEAESPLPYGRETWWARYVRLALPKLSPTARLVLEEDSRAIVWDCIPGPETDSVWPATRVRTGIIVGAVQSGKTASMLAVTALLIDASVDILIVLGGTRIALWKQTYERLLKQLDGTTPETAAERWAARVLVPHPLAVSAAADERSTPTAYMTAAGGKIENALRERRPILLVIPKIEAHLLAASRELHARVARVSPALNRKLHMVVMDDEADDASVLDSKDSKTIPRRVEMLWSENRHGETASEHLYATYVAYTATPQANFLQESHNPLSPRSFCAALRAPYKAGPASGSRRSATFAEPEGVAKYYCGGELFYNELTEGDAAFCQATRYPQPEEALSPSDHERRVRAASDTMLRDALRAFLVAGAIRALEAQRRGQLLYSPIQGPISRADIPRLPPPHGMLVHPSARQEVHADEARRLVLISSGMDPDDPGLAPCCDLALDVAAIRRSLDVEPAAWRTCLDSYHATRQAIATWPGAGDLATADPADWPTIAGILRNEVIPHLRMRIINSDPATDDRPRYEAEGCEDGTLRAPADLLTIFVSGNVMSRGITIEGLSTSVFTRPASEPAADTQMQMQRWFGYRGSHVHLCRVFVFGDQLTLFRMYHEHDVAMRNEILAGMDRAVPRAPNVVLQGPRSLATAKIPTTRLPLHPGATPSVKLIETDDEGAATANSQLLIDVLGDGEWESVGPPDRPRGILRKDPVALDAVAALLDRFRYSQYDPSMISDPRYSRWQSLEDHLQILAAERPFFRPPGRELGQTIELDPRGCPYSIAAYLRLWGAALRRTRCDGLYPSDAEGRPWALEQPLMRSPQFFLGVAFGEADASRWDGLAKRGVKAMRRGDDGGRPRLLNTLWGRRSEGGAFYGDQLFDYNVTGLQPPHLLGPGPLWRPRGHPGLVLFHVIRSNDAPFDAVTVGLALPHGGPEQFAALPAPGKEKR